MTNTLSRLSGIIVVVVLSVGIGACDSNNDQVPAAIRVIHAAAGTGDVDAYIDGELLARGLAYEEVAPYVGWEPGLQLVEFRVTVNGVERSLTRQILFDEDTAYTVLLSGVEGGEDIIAIQDDRSTIAFGRARLHVVHAATSAQSIAVSVSGSESGESVLDASLLFGEASADQTVEVGTYDFTVEAPAAGQRVDLQDQEIVERRVYLLVVASKAGGGLTTILAVDG